MAEATMVLRCCYMRQIGARGAIESRREMEDGREAERLNLVNLSPGPQRK
jgi:hypothetical protein